MIRSCRAATVEKKPGWMAASCLPIVAPGMLHMLKPRRWRGVVKYCATTGVANLASSSATPSRAVIRGGSVRMKVKATRSRTNQMTNARAGVLLPPSFASFAPNILAYAASFAIPQDMLTSVTSSVATKPSLTCRAASIDLSEFAVPYVAAYTIHIQRKEVERRKATGRVTILPRRSPSATHSLSPEALRVIASSNAAISGATASAVSPAAAASMARATGSCAPI
mmetsp:Transcript_39346/g.69196  ORF Transcript_39346/g.69196 Transcript_39346/m.69196 type:complete len:225 (+) Transcript_39346:359-1033(+)